MKNLVLPLFFMSMISTAFAQTDGNNSSGNTGDELTETLSFNFCSYEPDLRIYSANSTTPVPDDDEFLVGAEGLDNQNIYIKVEFLEIEGITSGEVELRFKLYDLGGYDVWNEDLTQLLTSVNAGESITLTRDASELPITVYLQTDFPSDTYRDIRVEMTYDGNTDRARATVYPENNTPAIVIDPLDGDSYNWRPDNPYTGTNDFIVNINNSLVEIIDNNLGNYQITTTVGGHVIDDFLDNGRLSFRTIKINEDSWGFTIQAFNSNIQYSVGRSALKIYDQTNNNGVIQMEGFIPPYIFLLHELAHAWLYVYDPILDDIFSTTDEFEKMTFYQNPIYNLSGHNYTSSFEHDLILEKLENPACTQLNYAIRKYYNNAIYTDSQQQTNILSLTQPSLETDVFYRAINSLVITPE